MPLGLARVAGPERRHTEPATCAEVPRVENGRLTVAARCLKDVALAERIVAEPAKVIDGLHICKMLKSPLS